MSVNKVILLGNLGKDPVVRNLGNDRNVANFSLATNERRKDKSGNVITKTEWHNITIYSPLAEIAQKYLKKGSQVYLEGKIESREYTDKEGVNRRAYEIICRDMTLMGGGGNSPNDGTSTSMESSIEKAPVDSMTDGADDDLPF